MACCDITDKNIHGFRRGFTRNYSKYIKITIILFYKQAAGGLNLCTNVAFCVYNSNFPFRDMIYQK